MHKNLIPDRMYKNIYKITPERLAKYGKKAVIFDIDNTVAPYEIKVPTVKMKQYFEALKENGIEAAFVSNNNSERTEIFNAELQLFCIPDAGKPSPSGILLCIEHFGIEKEKIILVGDQIFTDCIAAHRAGIECWRQADKRQGNMVFPPEAPLRKADNTRIQQTPRQTLRQRQKNSGIRSTNAKSTLRTGR